MRRSRRRAISIVRETADLATDNTQALQDDQDRTRPILERIPAGRWGRAEELGGAAVFLVSDAAAYVSGAILPVDGGWPG